jgi:hypothetical protein
MNEIILVPCDAGYVQNCTGSLSLHMYSIIVWEEIEISVGLSKIIVIENFAIFLLIELSIISAKIIDNSR